MRDAIGSTAGARAPAPFVHPHDTLTVLTHATRPLAKRWEADGQRTQYLDAKYFHLREEHVQGIEQLSALLTVLEGDSHSCVIRGRHVGEDEARRRDPEYKQGTVRRALAQFEDQPLHSLMIDIDRFEPLSCDPLEDPEMATQEAIAACLPPAFHGCSYHWQLSGSAGAPECEGVLKAHLWFWLRDPLDCAALRDWAVAGDGVRSWPVDVAVLRVVQPHYTAAPVFAEGVVNPVGRRSGLVQGPAGDAVPLVVDQTWAREAADALRHAGGHNGHAVEVPGEHWPRHEVLAAAGADDPVLARLTELGLVKPGVRGPGGDINIVCPFAELHSTSDGPSSCQYFPPHTRGYALCNIKCMHSSCEGRTRGAWLARLGLREGPGGGGAVEPVEATAGGARLRGESDGIPEARRLCTDQANARRMADAFGRRVLMCGGQWYAWDGRRWAPNDAEIHRCACNLSRLVDSEAQAWGEGGPAGAGLEKAERAAVAKALRGWATRCEMAPTQAAAIGMVRKMLAVLPQQMDRSPWLLNCANGTVDLQTGAMREHRADDYITRMIDLDYRPGHSSELWRATLRAIMREPDGGPLTLFLRRWFGYCLSGDTREQVFVVHWGGGANGKSTVLETMSTVMGEYATTAAPGLITGAGLNRHPTEIAHLRGMRMVTSHESGEASVLREEFIKQQTGSDPLTARRMREDFFTFIPTHKLQLLTNHKPAIKGQDEGLWRRVLLLPYAARFGAAEDVAAGAATGVRDMALPAKLKEREELEGVLAWAVRGAVEWQAKGLQPPWAVREAVKAYQGESDRVAQFVAECCEVGEGLSAPLTHPMGGGIYQEYVSWCNESGLQPISKVRLLSELSRVLLKENIVLRTTDKKEGARKVGEKDERRAIKVIFGITGLTCNG